MLLVIKYKVIIGLIGHTEHFVLVYNISLTNGLREFYLFENDTKNLTDTNLLWRLT